MRSLCSVVLLALVFAIIPQYSRAAEVESIPDSYAMPATMIQIADGPRLNLRCSGSGERVVLFEAGGNADSSAWYRVLPMLQGHARVCAYDRAGFGFSDEGALPRDLDARVADLHKLVRAAEFTAPIILVGHSLGSNIVRRYAEKFPGQVQGLVLVDPPEQGPDESMPESWRQADAAMLAQRNSLLAACEEAAVAGQLDPAAPPLQNCLRAPPPWMGERVVAAVRKNKLKPAFWRTLRSELAQNERIFSQPVSESENLGAIPLILLSAGEPYRGVADDVRVALETSRRHTHDRILGASTRSKEIKVEGASHDIPMERPGAIAAAVKEIVTMSAELESQKKATPGVEPL